MTTVNLGMDAAFDRLRRYAGTDNARLSAVARQVVETDWPPRYSACLRWDGEQPDER